MVKPIFLTRPQKDATRPWMIWHSLTWNDSWLKILDPPLASLPLDRVMSYLIHKILLPPLCGQWYDLNSKYFEKILNGLNAGHVITEFTWQSDVRKRSKTTKNRPAFSKFFHRHGSELNFPCGRSFDWTDYGQVVNCVSSNVANMTSVYNIINYIFYIFTPWPASSRILRIFPTWRCKLNHWTMAFQMREIIFQRWIEISKDGNMQSWRKTRKYTYEIKS